MVGESQASEELQSETEWGCATTVGIFGESGRKSWQRLRRLDEGLERFSRLQQKSHSVIDYVEESSGGKGC